MILRKANPGKKITSMVIYSIGYDRIVQAWNLPSRPPGIGIDTGAKKRRQDRLPDGRNLQVFDEGYDKGARLRRETSTTSPFGCFIPDFLSLTTFWLFFSF